MCSPKHEYQDTVGDWLFISKTVLFSTYFALQFLPCRVNHIGIYTFFLHLLALMSSKLMVFFILWNTKDDFEERKKSVFVDSVLLFLFG